jgi:hypothetical protein
MVSILILKNWLVSSKFISYSPYSCENENKDESAKMSTRNLFIIVSLKILN